MEEKKVNQVETTEETEVNVELVTAEKKKFSLPKIKKEHLKTGLVLTIGAAIGGILSVILRGKNDEENNEDFEDKWDDYVGFEKVDDVVDKDFYDNASIVEAEVTEIPVEETTE